MPRIMALGLAGKLQLSVEALMTVLLSAKLKVRLSIWLGLKT